MDKKKTRYIPVAYDDLKNDTSGPLMYDAETDTAYVGEESSGTESNTRTVKVFDCTFKPFGTDRPTSIVTTDHLDEIHECIQTFTPFVIRNLSTPRNGLSEVYWFGVVTSPMAGTNYDLPGASRTNQGDSLYVPTYAMYINWESDQSIFTLYYRSSTVMSSGSVKTELTKPAYVYSEERGYCFYGMLT